MFKFFNDNIIVEKNFTWVSCNYYFDVHGIIVYILYKLSLLVVTQVSS